MDDRIRISSTWLVIIAVGLVLFSYGAHSHKLFLEGLGAIASVDNVCPQKLLSLVVDEDVYSVDKTKAWTAF